MYLIISIIIISLLIIFGSKIYLSNKERIKFFVEGYDEGFNSSEIAVLWRVSQVCNLEEPISLFFSLQSLTNCIVQIKAHADEKKSANSEKMKKLLTKLYEYRNRIEKEADKKRCIESTRSLTAGQKLRIIYPGKGVFSSEITNNGREITILVPTQEGQITEPGASWVNQTVNVYLWKTGDARYVFDTKVLGEGLFLGKPSLFLEHTSNLVRTQKRNAVRAKCHIKAQLYILKETKIDFNTVETRDGYKCVIEDISEKGALVRIGGKGVPNVQLRLQFQIQNRLIIMFGIVRTVEFNEQSNQSRLHFECIHIENDMKNQILSYVYNILPQSEKEIYDAMTYTDLDAKDDLAHSTLTQEESNRISEEINNTIPEYEYDDENYSSNENNLDDTIDSSELDNTDDLNIN